MVELINMILTNNLQPILFFPLRKILLKATKIIIHDSGTKSKNNERNKVQVHSECK